MMDYKKRYENAKAWLEQLHKEANQKGDHETQRMIEVLQEQLWRLEDLES